MRRGPLVAAGLAATLLAGCSVGLVDTASESTSSTSTGPATPDPGGPSTSPAPSDPATSTRATDLTVAVLRARFAGEVSRRISCPGGTARIEQAAVVVELAEPCGHVTVNGSGAVLLAGTLGTLTVAGAAVTVVATEIDNLTLSSSSSEIYWSSGQPDIDDQGAANVAVLIPKE